MELEKFIALRPYLYHITDKENLAMILGQRILKSTVTLVDELKIPDGDLFLRTRRIGHKKITNGKVTISIRDQDPLFEKIVVKNLTHGMTFGDFVHMINARVFFWAKESDMRTHYTRYEKQGELPIILRVSTADLININRDTPPKFCRLNSGAPRCSSHYAEGAPPRGMNTFLDAQRFEGTASSIREVTFEAKCKLPDSVFISKHPSKPFKELE